jgi:hypothetical protein
VNEGRPATGQQDVPFCSRGRQRQTLPVRATSGDEPDWTGPVEEMPNDRRPTRRCGWAGEGHSDARERMTWSRVNEKRRTRRRNAEPRQHEPRPLRADERTLWDEQTSGDQRDETNQRAGSVRGLATHPDQDEQTGNVQTNQQAVARSGRWIERALQDSMLDCHSRRTHV